MPPLFLSRRPSLASWGSEKGVCYFLTKWGGFFPALAMLRPAKPRSHMETHQSVPRDIPKSHRGHGHSYGLYALLYPAHLAPKKEPKTGIRQNLVPLSSLGYVAWSKSLNPLSLSFLTA